MLDDVAVHSYDRCSQDGLTASIALDKMDTYGVRLHAIREGLRGDGPNDVFMFNIYGALAVQFSDMIPMHT